MAHRKIITLGRQFGSGGREIAKQIAKSLGVAYYDKELLVVAARESGLSPELLDSHDERPVSSLLYSLYVGPYSAGQVLNSPENLPISQQFFLAIFESIRKVSSEGDCVIVGRCADYVLRNDPDCVNVFIHAPLEKRIACVMERQPELTKTQAKDLIVKTDKKRASYYNSYSDRKWGAIDTYHLTLDSSLLGVEGTAAFICDFINKRG